MEAVAQRVSKRNGKVESWGGTIRGEHRSLDLLSEYTSMARERKEPFAVAMTITPKVAADLLVCNIDNRAMKTRKVAEYAANMRAGLFNGLNGETIKISKDGLLNDGQNRLQAVIDSGVPLRTLVVFGVTRDSRWTNDQGGIRTFAEYAFMAGHVSRKDAKAFSGVVNICHAYDNDILRGQTTGSKKTKNGNARLNSANVSKAELLEYARENSKLLHDALETIGNKGVMVLGGRARLAAGYFIVRRANRNSPDRVKEFFRRVVENDVLAKLTGEHTLRARLESDATKGHVSQYATIHLIIKGWNAHIRNKRAAQFEVTHRMPDVEIA